MSRQRWLAGLGISAVAIAGVLVLIVLGLAQTRTTRPAWIITHDVIAGTVLSSDNTKSIAIPDNGDYFSVYTGDPNGKRVSHALLAQHLISNEDIESHDISQVTISLVSAPHCSREIALTYMLSPTGAR